MIIDVHGHLGNINLAPFWQADAPRLEEHLAKAGVHRLCITAARSIMYDLHEGNAELAAALQKSERLLGYVTVNPFFPEQSLRDLEYLDQPKFIGVKVHPDYHGFDIKSRDAQRFLDRVAERTKLFLFHVSCMPGTGFADADAIAAFASRHPQCNFIMAHLAGVFQNDHYPYYPNYTGPEAVSARGCRNVFVDTAHHLMYVYPGVMERMVALIGADQLVYGTDCPLQGHMQMRFAIEIIQSLDLPEAEKAKILSGNARKLIGNDRYL